MKILIVEDEQDLRETIRTSLLKEKFVVETAADYFSALDKINDYDYDCILLDIMLPGGSGLDLLRELKHLRRTDSVLIISAKDSLDDKVDGLELGADDYLTKPFSVDELLARLRVTQRRLNLQASGEVGSSVFVNGPLKIDFAAGCVWLNDEELHLTPIEYKLLCVLAHNVGKVLTHTAITQKVWGSSQENDIASLRVYMASLRKKLESGAHSLHLVQTHVGVGYRMLRVEADDSPEE